MRAAALAALLLAGCALQPHADRRAVPRGELVLDLDAPLVDAEVAGVRLRLRVAPSAPAGVELNPAAAARLARLGWERGFVAEVGREALDGRGAATLIEIDGHRVAGALFEHGRDCCQGVDGEVGVGLLDFATIRFVRAGAPMLPPRRYRLVDDPRSGLAIAEDGLLVRLAPFDADSTATAAAGAMLAARGQGRFDGPTVEAPAAFGLTRPTRLMRLARAVTVAGFRFDAIPVRVADFRGRERLPAPPMARGDLVVTGRAPPQQAAWPAVTIGRDRLAGCAAITIDRLAMTVELRCPAG